MSLKDEFKEFFSSPGGTLLIVLGVLGLLCLPFAIAAIMPLP